MPPRVRILGVPVDVAELGDVIRQMEHWVQERGPCRWIALTSSHGVLEGYKHPEFKAVLETADLSLPDGKWTARLAGRHAHCGSKQVRGADLLVSFCDLANQKGYSNFFFGDTEEVLALLTNKLLERFPKLVVAGTHSPPFRSLTPEEDACITDLINEASPDVLWVGLGLPKQEYWIVNHWDKLRVSVAVAVGAAFKFVAGKVKPAPRWMSECGLEWAWRLAHEPRRLWHRVLIYGPQFVAHTLLELTGLRKCD